MSLLLVLDNNVGCRLLREIQLPVSRFQSAVKETLPYNDMTFTTQKAHSDPELRMLQMTYLKLSSPSRVAVTLQRCFDMKHVQVSCTAG